MKMRMMKVERRRRARSLEGDATRAVIARRRMSPPQSSCRRRSDNWRNNERSIVKSSRRMASWCDCSMRVIDRVCMYASYSRECLQHSPRTSSRVFPW